MRIVLAFLASVVGSYLVATTAASAHVLSQLGDMGVELSAGEQFAHVSHDWLGFTGIFLPVILLGLLIGFVVARLLLRIDALANVTTFAYVAAGAVALLSVHIILNLLFDMHPIASSRTVVGLLLQAVAGGVGGWLFAKLSYPSARPVLATL